MRGRGKTALLAALAAVVVAALVVFGFAPKGGSGSGRRAPGLPAEHLGGAAITLPGLLAQAHGRSSAVVFWASWCGPCATEAPALQAFSRSAQGRGRIVGVDWSDGRSSALAFVKRFHWTFPTMRDGEGLIGNEYGMTGLPTTFVLDGHGRIAATLRGPQTALTLTAALARAEGG